MWPDRCATKYLETCRGVGSECKKKMSASDSRRRSSKSKKKGKAPGRKKKEVKPKVTKTKGRQGREGRRDEEEGRGREKASEGEGREETQEVCREETQSREDTRRTPRQGRTAQPGTSSQLHGDGAALSILCTIELLADSPSESSNRPWSRCTSQSEKGCSSTSGGGASWMGIQVPKGMVQEPARLQIDRRLLG